MSRKLILASTITMVLAGTDVSALGLGGLRSQSVLNQPYLGEIALQDVRADELDSVKASLASQEAFSKAGVERYYYLTHLRFTPELSPQGKPVIRVSSKDPIREPYMDFLVEVVWPSGQLIKEYTVLLDPPTLAKQSSAPAVRTARAESAAAGQRSSSSVAAASGRAASGRGEYIPAPSDGFPIYAGPVGNGKGLWAIARETAPPGATVAQTAMALYRNNQDAFIRGNINRLLVGKTLVIPSKSELFALDPAEAERDYAAALRGHARYRAPITDVTPEMLDSRLRVSGARAPTGAASAASQAPAPTTPPKVQQDVMLALETSESTRQETVELRDRIQELETQLADIQSLLQLRNAELARMQSAVAGQPGVLGESSASSAEAGKAEEKAPEEAPQAPAPEVVAEPAASGKAGEDLTLVPDEPAAAPSAEEAGQASPAPESTEAAKQALDAALAQDEAGSKPSLIPVPSPTPTVAEETTEVVAAPPPKPKPQPKAAPVQTPEESSTWHSLLLPLAGLAGVTAVGIMLFSWITMRRRREEEALADEGLDLDEDRYDTLGVTTEPRSSVAADDRETVAASVKLDKEPASEPISLHTSEADADSGVSLMSSLSSFDAETDEADVLSEADIYIAYGRYSEAQDLLKTELDRFPERLDIKYKLAEAFAASRDPGSLTAVLDEIRAAGGDTQDPMQWAKLQRQQEQLQSGAVAPAPGQALASDAEDSLGLDSDDSFSLDISDAQRAPSQDSDSDLLGDLDLGEEPEEPEVRRPAERPLLDLDLGDSELDQDAFGEAETVAVDQGADQPTERRGISEDSEIELTLEEHTVEDIDDLDSIFDTNMIDEPTLVRNEMDGARPTDEDVGAAGPSGVLESSDSGGLPPDQESVPSDLLSSQWQIDSGIWDETATKLDLARAYIEMDDKDAAREILEEVVSEGRDEQKTEAQSMLDSLV